MSRFIDIDDERFWNILFDEAYVEGKQAERIEKELNKIIISNNDVEQRLGEYEDLEEQGLILRLPVSIDSEVWGIIIRKDDFLGSYRTLTRMLFKLDLLDKLGKTVFLTKEEAEQKLKELSI